MNAGARGVDCETAHVVENRRGVCSEWSEKLRRGRDDYAWGRRTVEAQGWNQVHLPSTKAPNNLFTHVRWSDPLAPSQMYLEFLQHLGLLWNAGETRVKCRNEFHRNADVIRPLVSQESFRRKRWRKEMCLTVHTGNQKSASTSWNRGQDSRGIEVLPFLRLQVTYIFSCVYPLSQRGP